MKGKKILISLLAAAVAAGTMAFPAFAAFETVEKLSETDVLGGYSALTEDGTIALSSAETFETSRDAVTEYTTDTVVYNVSGKVTVNGTSWVNILKASATGVENVKTVKFIGLTSDAEINIANGPTLLAWQGHALNVEFENLTLSNSDPKWVGDAGHATNYFTAWLRCTDAANCSVSYKNCTFTNGSCNNQYGKTVYTDCSFNNASEYCLWLYGGDTEVTGTKNTFVGKKGVKVYSEDATKAVNATIENAEFDISGKPAVVSSTWGKLELNNVDASKCQYGILSSEPNNHTKDGALINDTLADSTIDGKEPTFVAKVGNIMFTNTEAAKKEAGSTGTVEAIVAKVGDLYYTDLKSAIAAGNTITVLADIAVKDGDIPKNATLTFNGENNPVLTFVDGTSGEWGNGYYVDGSTLAFNNLTLTWKIIESGSAYQGFIRPNKVTYNKCVINNEMYLHGEEQIFTGCTFNQASADRYNVWTYAAKKAIFNDCEFNSNGKSVLIYNEGGVPTATIDVNGCEFKAENPATGKAAIEIDSQYISGEFTLNIDSDETYGDTTATGFDNGSNSDNSLYNLKNYKVVEENSTLGANSTVTVKNAPVSPVTPEKLAEKLKEKAVAEVNGVYYTSFTAAFDAANAMTEPAVIECFGKEIITNKGRYAIKNSITINGNGATIKKSDNANSSVEFSTEELDADVFTKDITFTVNNLNNIAVWGYRKSDVAFNVNLNGCKDVDRIYITGTNGTTNIAVDDCTFTKYDSANNDTSIYTNNPGSLVVTNSTFTAIPIALNINFKAAGERTIKVSNCTFINCGEPSNTNNPTYAAPIRFVTTQEDGKLTAEVTGCTIENEDDSKKTHGDILLGDGRTGKESTANVTVLVSDNNSDLTVKKEYPDETESTTKEIPAGASATVSNVVVADTIKLLFKQADENDNTLYNIVLNGNGMDINRLNAAEFKFALTTTDAITYEIAAAGGLALIPQADGMYEFHFDGKDFTGSITDTGAEIVIGTVKFEGYGKFTFFAKTGRATATTTEDNLVTEFVVTETDGKGMLVIGEDENKINTEIEVPKQILTINIAMNQTVTDNATAYQDMKVVISGGDLAGETLTFDLGTDGKVLANGAYNFGVELTQNRLYTVTVSGAGYRTARYTVAMTEDKTMNFWNNVMSNEITVVDDVKDTVNFLAGDIVKDGKINIYDLSAVVAYFGTENNQAEYSKFAKYDLNRDGKIDMMDISIVLTSWGK